jgi:lactoylglutathione lyase
MKKLIVILIIFTALNTYAQKATFNHLAMHISNKQKSYNFYHNVIGLDSVASPFKDGMHLWMKMDKKMTLHLLVEPITVAYPIISNHLCFALKSVEKFAAKLDTMHIPYQDWKGNKSQITTRGDGVKQIYFQDPDSNWVEINND